MSSIPTQFPAFSEHHNVYSAIDPKTTLAGSAAGKVVFITGASRGIGLATAISFAQAGAKGVYITSRKESDLEKAKAQVDATRKGTRCFYKVCDAANTEQVRAAIDDCVAKLGGIDVAIANAGVTPAFHKFAEEIYDPEDWWSTFEINLKGVYLVAKFAMPHLVASAKNFQERSKTKSSTEKQQAGGHLILVSSIAAQGLMEGVSAYSITKHSVNRFCEFVNLEYGEQGVKCFSLHPGAVPTELTLSVMPEEMQSVLKDEPGLAAGFMLWLTSGDADWMQGRFISCNWDVDEVLAKKEEILNDDLFVNRLRTKA